LLQPTVRSCAHTHALVLVGPYRFREKGKKCDGCRTSLRESKWSYWCEACDFDVHARCAKLRERVVTAFHPYPLKLLPKSPYPPRHLQCELCDFNTHFYCNSFVTIEP
jgi:hypothetical protein